MSKINSFGKEVFEKLVIFVVLIIVLAGYFYIAQTKPLFRFSPVPKSESVQDQTKENIEPQVLARFEYLSKNGNSSCSSAFKDSIGKMPDNARLVGSCCSPMSLHRYSEQTEGLKKYQGIFLIPSDPYDIEVGLAKKLLSYYDLNLTAKEQEAYDFAMQQSDEKGPCCCKCWRWFVYGGLGKYLIRSHNFTGEQVTEVWNLSDGCGGEKHTHT